MKTIFTLLSFISLTQIANCQDSIKYNFIDKTPPETFPVKHGSGTVFRINDINLFLYEVKITADESEYNTEQPAIFDLLQPEKLTSDNLNNASSEFVSNQTESDDAEAIDELSNAMSEFDIGTDQLNMFFYELDSEKSFVDSLQNDNRIQILEEKIKQLTADIEREKERITELTKIVADKYSIELANLSAEIKKLHEVFEFLEGSKILKNDLVEITKTCDLTQSKAVIETDKLAINYPYILESMNISLDFDKSFRQFKSSYDVFLSSEVVKQKFNGDDCKIKKSLSPILEEAESLKSLVSKTDYQKVVQECQALYKALRSQNSYIAVSDPVQASKDEIRFEVKIEPRKEAESILCLEKRHFNTVTPVYGGVKIDFSTGLFFSSLVDKSYSSNPLTADSSRSTISENAQNNIGQVSIGGMMHISRRSAGYIKPTLSFGLGVNSTDFTNANIFIGGGVVIGNKERFIVSGGYTMSNIDFLRSKYKLNTEYSTSELDDELTESTLKGGWFFSLTYNLGKSAN